MFKVVNVLLIFISLLAGHFLLIKPEISLILGSFLVFLIIKLKDKKILIITLIIFLLSLIRILLFKSSIFTNYAIVIQSKENYFLVYNGLSKFYVYNQDNQYNLFDIIYLDGLVSDYSFTNYESQFDFNEYLKDQLIFKEILLSKSYCIFKFPINMNKIYIDYIGRLSEEGKTVVSKLLFNKDYSDEYKDFINNNSLFYLLSISSLHIYSFVSILKSLLETKFSSKNTNKIILVINLLILIISNYKIGVLRILIQSIINYINDVKKLEINYLERVCLSLSILIIIDSSYCFSDSILYHITIPCFIVFSKDAISTFKKKHQDIIKGILFYFLINLISIFLNDNFSIMSFLLLPLLSFSVVLLFSLSLIMFILPIEGIINLFSKGLIFLLKPIFNLNSKIYIEGNIVFFIIVILLFIFLLISIENKRKKYQKLISYSLIFYLIMVNLPIKNQFSSNVYFINVGQGDSTLIVDKGLNILIDTGGVKNNNIAEETLIPFLKKKNIYYLDYVFLTHQDYDHVGAFEILKSNFKVLNYNLNNNFTTLKVGGITFYNLNPSIDNSENDDSLVLYFTVRNKSYLMMGDASKEVEKEIMKKYQDLDVDILKVGHHGSDTSTSEELLKMYNPQMGIISCGRNNYYNHPSKEVLFRLEKYDVEIRRTDKEGTIKI